MSELLDKTRTEFRVRHLPREIKIEKLKQAKKLSHGVNSKRTEQAYLYPVRYNKRNLTYDKKLSHGVNPFQAVGYNKTNFTYDKELSHGVNPIQAVRYNKRNLTYDKELSQEIKLRGSCRSQSY